MPAAITPSSLPWQVHHPAPLSGQQHSSAAGNTGAATLSAPVPHAAGAADAPWRSQTFAPVAAKPAKRSATRYEKFTTKMVLFSGVLTLGITACLHIVNYGLETKTSSTSGTHSGFYKEDE